MKSKYLYVLVFIILIASYFVGGQLKNLNTDNTDSIRLENKACDPVKNECLVVNKEEKIYFGINQKPSALKPFSVTVRLSDYEANSVYVEFYMIDMDMGINRYKLKPDQQGVWTANVVLPVCSLSRTKWVARLNINNESKRIVAEFFFDQKK